MFQRFGFPLKATQPIYSILSCYSNSNFNHLITNYSLKKTCTLPLAYLGGMAGYLCSIPLRAVELIIDILFALGALLLAPCKGRKFFQKHAFVCLASFAFLGSSFIGTFCPLIAYKIDLFFLSYVHVWNNKRLYHPFEYTQVSSSI